MHPTLTLLRRIAQTSQPPPKATVTGSDQLPPHTSADAVRQSGAKPIYVLRARAALNVGVKVRVKDHREYRYTQEELAAILTWLKSYQPKVGNPLKTRCNWTEERRKKFEKTIAKRKARRRK